MEFMKRLFDLILALILILPAGLVILLAAIPVWIESRANPIFVQVRVGRQQSLFRLIKLRTLLPDTADMASHQVSIDRVMRSGKFFRKTKIDELPQVLNILLGQMSFVGPRPCLPSQAELRSAREKRGVYTLMPGITGIAQIRGIDMSTPEELAIADASYLGSWSIIVDLHLLAVTAFGVGRGDALGKRA